MHHKLETVSVQVNQEEEELEALAYKLGISVETAREYLRLGGATLKGCSVNADGHLTRRFEITTRGGYLRPDGWRASKLDRAAAIGAGCRETDDDLKDVDVEAERQRRDDAIASERRRQQVLGDITRTVKGRELDKGNGVSMYEVTPTGRRYW
ncbi:MAG: hypothetical protein E6Q97_07060 [Desulfurellales bacterium]|nr:MAG: hypothetical protein E6Q97_07060 [Desulfurellales bacterium]